MASSRFTSTYLVPPRIQHFSLPRNVIFYISKNPCCPKVYEKLIRICKYFYLNHSVIPFEQLYYEKEWWLIFDIKEKLKSIIKNSVMKTFPFKLWIIDKLDILNYDNHSMASLLSSKLYRCDINFLRLYYQNMTLEEFKLLANPATVKSLKINKLIVKDGNQKIVPIEKLIEILPNLNNFYFYAFTTPIDIKEQLITSETAGNLAYIPHFPNLKTFELQHFPETFYFEKLFKSIKKPFKVDIRLNTYDISNSYKNRLRKFVVNLVKKGYTENQPPYIFFNRMPLKPLSSLNKLRDAYQQNEKNNSTK